MNASNQIALKLSKLLLQIEVLKQKTKNKTNNKNT